MSYYPNATQPTSATYPYGGYQAQYPYQPGAASYPWQYHHYYQLPRPGQPATPARPATTTTTTSSPTPQRASNFQTYNPPTASTSYARDTASTSSTAGTGRGGKRQSNMKGLFTKELKNIMYGFGDDRNPANDTVSVMEEILIEYITDVCLAASGPSKRARLSVEDLRKVLSRPADAKKLARMEELIFMQEDIKRARAQFEESDNPKGF